METEEKEMQFNCCPDSYSAVTYELTLDRLSSFYIIYIILPIMALSALFLLVFFIPADSGERMGYGVNILLSLTVYLLVIFEIVPANSYTRSMLGTCFIILFFLLSAGMVFALLNTNLASYTRRPHRYLLKFISSGIICKLKDLKNEENIALSPRNGRKTNHAIDDVIDENEEYSEIGRINYNEEWKKISKKLDKIFAVLFLLLLILLPLFSSAILPKEYLHS